MPRSRFQKQSPEASQSEPVKEAESVVQLRDPAPEVPLPQPLSPEAEILARAQAGDHHAFAHLYSLHKRRIYSLCLRMVGNVAEAEDLTQEAFLQLHRKIATFRGDSAFSTWLHRLSINVVLMHLRKKGLPLMSLDEAMEPSYDDGPGRSFGLLIYPLPAPSTVWRWKGLLQPSRLDIVSFLCFTMLKGLSIMR
jgi:RNA polymerase sigma-70 factor (ECF subfamily)